MFAIESAIIDARPATSLSVENSQIISADAQLTRSPCAVGILATLLTGFNTEPRQSAKALVAEFGSLGAALKGSAGRVTQIVGPQGLTILRLVDAAIGEIMREPILEKPIISNTRALLDYLKPTMQHCFREEVRVLYFVKDVLIKDEVLSQGTVNKAYFHFRDLLQRCLELGSTAIILVHNHPSGDPTPSKIDIETTQALIDAARPLDIQVYDHLIIGTKGHVSMKSRGLM